ncbi:hypothetical protein [Salinimicrobium sp. HB62]|uniref:hypothetical protein n=1 Tax=Salinimicrobium sp. HB62 TaxID=3077781 RepID=UPI002D785BA3|nr:hypothetical protein [Salinimicrobium sp. HB62]
MIDLLVKLRFPVTLLFFGCQFLWIKLGANLMDWDSLSIPALMSVLFLTGFWLLILFDMINSRIFNKTFWLMSMLILPNLAPVVRLSA